jgi:hypothetical protein
MPPKHGGKGKGDKKGGQAKPKRTLYPGEVVQKPQGASHATVNQQQGYEFHKSK